MAKGFFLLEIVISAAIMTSLTAFILYSIPKISNEQLTSKNAIILGQFFHTARWAALAKNTDIELKIENQSVTARNSVSNELIQILDLPKNLTLSQTHSIGFTSSGSTKFSGTISLAKKQSSHTVTLGVGFGKISVK